ncbi:MAG: hypothetical protein ACOC6G_01100 [Thermoproteota archaeon]
MPLDWTILGIVFALILFIIAFSGIALYIAFRIKEIFREEKRRGILIAKVGFLIGILFLAGGTFYFFATTLTPTAPSQPPNNQTPTAPPSNQTGTPELTLTVSYPSEVSRGTQFTISFTITNPTQYTAHDVNIQADELLPHFTLISSTHNTTGNVIEIGDTPPGTTISSLKLKAPTKPGPIQGTISLTYTEMNKAINREISISVTGKPTT